jgi:hypothetical protein
MLPRCFDVRQSEVKAGAICRITVSGLAVFSGWSQMLVDLEDQLVGKSLEHV